MAKYHDGAVSGSRRIMDVLLTVLLIVIQMVVNMVCMVNDFVSMVLSVGFTMLLCAPVYFLMVSRIHKRFDSFVRYYTSAGWLAAIILFTVICGFLGSMIGGKLIQKHFKKAGVL